MSSSNLVAVMTGTVVDKILENGDREEVYTWVIPPLRSLSLAGPGETTVFSNLTIPKPSFPRGVWANPSWREKFNAKYMSASGVFTFELPYPEPSRRRLDWEWRLMTASFELDGQNVVFFPFEIQDEEGRPIGMGSRTAWKEKKTTIVKARVRTLATVIENSTIVKMKILGKRLDGDSDLFCRRDKKRVKLNPIILATFNNPELSDVQLVCQGETFLCHKYVLSVGTPVFKRMFLSDSKENQEGKVHIEDVAKDVLRLLLTWMYGEDIALKLETETLGQRIELYKVADRYLLEELKESLVTDIVRSVTVETAFEIYILGDTYNEERFKTKGFEVMKKEREIIFSNNDVFNECHKRYPSLLQDILKSK